MMMLMMPFMLLFWVALIVGVMLLARWVSRGGELTREGRLLRGRARDARLSAGTVGDGGLLPDDEIERGVFEAHRRIEELQEQLSWQGRLLEAEPGGQRVPRRSTGRRVNDRADGEARAATTSPQAGHSRRRRAT